MHITGDGLLMDTVREIIGLIVELVLSLGQTVTYRDVVDILIIAYLIYRILSFMRRTSASSVIKGIIFVLFIAFLSNLLKLSVVTYVLNQMMQMGVIVLIVLFQPELRKLFEQVGSSRLGILLRARIKRESAEAVLQSIITAAEAMSHSKTGAIIVYERKIGLNDYAVTGTRIDASVTSELIQNIFYHNAHLHDGALLVRDDRLLAAACMLPLSNNINLNRDLGMRHRAGVGISERSDAVAVIVSEQTGAISVAVDGLLKRQLTNEMFEMLIRSELRLGDRKRDKKKTVKTIDDIKV